MKAFSYSIVFLLLFLNSCKPQVVERRIEVDEVVDYRKVLFEGNDSLPTFSLNNKRNLIDSLIAIDYWFDESSGRVFKWFNLKLAYKKVKVGAYKHYPAPGVYTRDVIEVIVNKKNMLLYERGLIKVQDMDSLLFIELKKTSFKHNEYLAFQWDERSSLAVVESIFNQIERGYLLFYDSLAHSKYNSPIHNLDFNQLESIKKEYPFKIIILVKNRPTQFWEHDKGKFFQGFYYKKK